jgi:hypothetical protein
MSSLFKNAVETIQLGVEDFKSADERRDLSAIRNLHAGVLLLCKEKLRRMSPDGQVLLAQRFKPVIGPAGVVEFVGMGKGTVGAEEIKERFKDLGIAVEWKRLEGLASIRHNLEHAFYQGSKDTLRQALSDAHFLIRDILTDVLSEEPVNILGPACWQALLENAELFEQQLTACKSTLEAIAWTTNAAQKAASRLECTACGSTLIRQRDQTNSDQYEMHLYCSACGRGVEIGRALSTALREEFAGEIYMAAKDGDTAPFETCPECGDETYVIEEEVCSSCGFSMPDDATCAVCGDRISIADYGECTTLCGYHAYTASKDD